MKLEVQFDRAGIHLPQLGLWLDARKRQRTGERVFISHAHGDHIAAHDEVILTAATSLFMRTRLPGSRTEHILDLDERRAFSWQGETFHVTPLNAGHIVGSAMAFIEWRDESLLYTGDFKLGGSALTGPCVPRAADCLIMETTFGLPRYRFPSEADVWKQISGFCHETISAGATPVLHAYSLGKSQELLHGLASTGLSAMLQRDVRKMTKLHEKLGINFPPHEPFDAANARGRIVIMPPQSLKTLERESLGSIRTAAVTGWAMDSSCRFRSGTDAAFPLSDHSDFDALLELVRVVNPKRVFTVHGFTREFAATLRERGIDAIAPGWHEQMALEIVT